MTGRDVAFLDPDQRVSILDLATAGVSVLLQAAIGATTRNGKRAIYVESEAANSELIMLKEDFAGVGQAT